MTTGPVIKLPEKTDRALRGIVLSNLFALGVVWVTDGGLLMLLWPYWLQSVVIGWYARKRMLALKSFTTRGLTMNDRPVPETVAGARSTANFFAVHYGFFHLGYLVFLLAFTVGGRETGIVPVETSEGTRQFAVGTFTAIDMLLTAIIAIGFVQTHRASHREHVDADLAGRPNLGTLMILPYARVIPMHLTIIFGAILGSGVGLLLFGGLKTVADLVMHTVEHRLLQRRR